MKILCIALQIVFGVLSTASVFSGRWPEAVALGIACGICRGLRNVKCSK